MNEWAIYHRERMITLKIPSYLGSKLAVLGGLCFLQCVVLLVIIHWGAGLQGPWLPMFLLLLLTALVGLAIGLAVSALAQTSEVAIALLPLILLPMVILAGVLQPIHKMSTPMKAIAQFLPSRWAFEGLLLMEVEKRPKNVPPLIITSPATSGQRPTPRVEKPLAQQDMAENFFPAETHRTSMQTDGVVLMIMLVVLTGSIGIVLRARDVH